ncbi:hypothetical protein ACFZAR_16900 [Streptomyces sp. NPDC008222]|uniref:hypothetical protein n=1 Tax=Streptomyces sp. NPDC008222 TaxID=3364820 RepID=UPI0036DFADA7
MAFRRGLPAALAAGALIGGSAGCGAEDVHEGKGGARVSPAGTVLTDTDEQGRHYRDVDPKGAPRVAVEVRPDSGGGRDIQLTVRHFRFSAAEVRPVAVAGRGLARLSLDGRSLTWLRVTAYRLPAALVPRGTHRVRARLYADDRTLWSVHGRPVEGAAALTSSGTERTPGPGCT